MKGNIQLKKILKAVLLFFSFTALITFFSVSAAWADEPLVIVIDPGHGGENKGAQYEGYTEKEMTMAVARAMKEELLKYDGVEVYLTHETDEDMAIKDRAAFAAERNADFLFCLHFNSSADHNYFGAEVWVPAGGEYYAQGYSFAQIAMRELGDLGLYSRGIKTRLNDRNDNYYGILRYSTYEGIPSVLIEHCHLDNEKDEKFYRQGPEQLDEFGRLDATAVAKYFRLKSESLGADYSNFPVPETEIPSDIIRPDRTEPELCQIEVTEINEETGEITVCMEAEDKDSYILYYHYSIDGGNYYFMPETWPRPEVWNQSLRELEFTINVPFDKEILLRAGACNGFDLWTESNIVAIAPIPDPVRLQEELLRAQEEALRKAQEQYEEITHEKQEPLSDEDIRKERVLLLAVITGIAALMIMVVFFMVKTIFVLIRGNKKR